MSDLVERLAFVLADAIGADLRDQARAVLAELERTHRVVPLEPTEEQKRAGYEFTEYPARVYTAMLSAAPRLVE